MPGANPCEHFGKCVNTEGSFQCQCGRGYTGPRCEIDINECLSMPCQNDATCLDRIGEFTCICMPGTSVNLTLTYTGTLNLLLINVEFQTTAYDYVDLLSKTCNVQRRFCYVITHHTVVIREGAISWNRKAQSTWVSHRNHRPTLALCLQHTFD